MDQETKEVAIAIFGMIVAVVLLFAVCGGSFGVMVMAFKFFAG